MKTKPMKRNLLLLAGLFIVIFTGCKKEKIIVKEVERDFRWKAHPVFQYENAIIMNSFSTDSCILFRGTNYTTIVGSNAANNGGSYDSIFGNYFLKNINQIFIPSNRTLPLTPDLIVDYDEELSSTDKSGKVYFVPTEYYGWSNSYGAYIYVSETDTSFTGFMFRRSSRNECMAINTLGQVLIPYNSSVNYELRFLLVNTSLTGTPGPAEIGTIKIIPIEDQHETYVDFLQSYKDMFFITTDSKTYIINSQGEISRKFDNLHLYSIIPKNDTLYTFGYDLTLPGMELLYSADNGFKWNKASNAVTETAYLNYSVIGNRVVGYWKSQLWEFSLNKNGYRAVNLDNDGLSGKIITSVSEYKDNVYVSTLTGVYYKNTTDLFQEKAAE